MGRIKQTENRLLRYALIAIGWTAVILGVIGIFLPLLPTTPFLLLAASCFAKSSERFHNWLLNQPQLGPYIHLYLDGKGVPAKAKAYILITLWITMTTSAIFFVEPLAIRGTMLLIAVGVTVHILKMPTMALESLPKAVEHQQA